VYRSLHRAACEERALMLMALGIASSVEHDGTFWRVLVDPGDALRALAQIHQYRLENIPTPAPPPLPPLHEHAAVGAVVYVLVLLPVAYAISSGWWRADAFELGALDGERVQAGEWWRVWTALTLHLSADHLFANLGAGVWFGYLAARQLGSGMAWLLIVTGAALANAVEAQWAPPGYQSVGASTAVFAALGLMAAHSWKLRYAWRQSRARRWAPLVAGVVLLGWLGTAGEGTDVIAHLLGFVVGGVLGALAGVPRIARVLGRCPQWLAGAFALAGVASAWACALAR
jgi:rhomboid protease GluP